MVGLIARALRARLARTMLAIGGIATSALLVMIIGAAYRGVRTAMVDYAGQPAVDLWIGPVGADNLIRGSVQAVVPLAVVDSLRVSPLVRRADALVKAFLPVHLPGDKDPAGTVTLLVVGYRVPDGLGGPPVVAAGVAPRRASEIALDRAAAFRLGVAVGDTVVLGSNSVVITGLTRGTNILATQFLFADFDVAARAQGIQSGASMVLVQLKPGTFSPQVATVLESRWPALRAQGRRGFVQANEREVLAGFLPLVTLIGVLGICAACVLVGLLVLSVVDERRGEIAVLMAVGAGDGRIRAALIAHALGLLLLGTVLGVVGAVALAAAIDRLLPLIPLVPSVRDALSIAGAFAVSGLAAALLPAVQLRRIDVLEAFRT